MCRTLSYWIFFIIVISHSYSLYSQKKNAKIDLTGNFSLNYDFYDYNTQNYNSFRAKYPENLVRFNANATLQIGEYFSIPFGINISNQKTSYNLPTLPDENLLGYIQNPRNNIHIDPTYKWVQAHIGSFTPEYSKLTTGDIQMFGLGLELNPGKLILATSYGKTQEAIEPDLSLNIQGSYRQKLLGASIGFGKKEGSKFTLNFVKIKDDISSVTTAPIGLKPIEGISFSPYIELKIGKNITFKTETAGSIYTADVQSSSLTLNEPALEKLNKLLTINASSKADFSHLSAIDWVYNNLSLGGEIKYIGPGFVPAGFRSFEKDIIDYKITSGIKLAEQKYNLKASFGIRTNNLKNTTLQKTHRAIANVNFFGQFTQNFSLSASFSNFGFTNNEISPTQKVEITNNSFQVSPSYTIKANRFTHLISAGSTYNQFNQFDLTLADFTNTKSQSFMANYMIQFKEIPLNLGISGMTLKNNSAVSQLQINNLNLTATYQLLDKKLKPSLQIGFVSVKRDFFTADNRLQSKLKLKYKINKSTQTSVTFRLNNNQYGSYRPGAVSHENRILFAFTKRFK